MQGRDFLFCPDHHVVVAGTHQSQASVEAPMQLACVPSHLPWMRTTCIWSCLPPVLQVVLCFVLLQLFCLLFLDLNFVSQLSLQPSITTPVGLCSHPMSITLALPTADPGCSAARSSACSRPAFSVSGLRLSVSLQSLSLSLSLPPSSFSMSSSFAPTRPRRPSLPLWLTAGVSLQ